MAIPYGGKCLRYPLRSSLTLSGAAYDTEKAFDSMFSTEPFMNTALKQWR